VIGEVTHRLNYISQNPYLRRIFNNTERQFDFREIPDDSQGILFELGYLRDDAAQIMTGTILTNLDAVLRDRKRALSQQPDNFVVNLPRTQMKPCRKIRYYPRRHRWGYRRGRNIGRTYIVPRITILLASILGGSGSRGNTYVRPRS